MALSGIQWFAFPVKEYSLKNKYAWVGIIIGVILVLDQATKYAVQKYVRIYEIIPVVPGFFNITHVRNRGAAFSILSGLPGVWRSAFFITVTLMAVAALAVLIKKTHERLLLIAFSLIAGGALGNMIDRIRFGEVVDFINLYVWEKFKLLNPWPSFNVADSAISIGVGLLAIDMLFGSSTKHQISNPK
jgi:signal peptidase II